MKRVITLIGVNRGQERFMHTHEAEAAVANGTACWPEDFQTDEVSEDEGFEPIRIENVRENPTLTGDWPEKAIITKGMQNQSFAQVFRTGTVVVTIGGRKAIYQSIGNDGKSADLKANLREVLDETPAEANEDDEAEDGSAAKQAVSGADDGAGTPSGDYAEAPSDASSDDDEGSEGGDTPLGDVTIPENWSGMHWKKRVKLAQDISGDESIEFASEADEIIQQYVQG